MGYEPSFLGSGKLAVSLPKLSPTLKAKAALNREAKRGVEPYILPYRHFSIVMNKERRTAFFTAVNIDGSVSYRLKRDSDNWILDPRIDDNEQAGEALYRKNDLDRGHLVRRLDPAWGANQNIAQVANDDTFHFTNAAPQHKDLNQKTWLGLENYILDNADNLNFKVSVFSGPILRDDDEIYRGIQLPKEFWKVVVMAKEDGNLSATAYLLSQESLLRNLEATFVFGKHKTFQVSVKKIAELTGLDFGKLSNFDPMEDQRESMGETELEIVSYDDIVF
jgi:endonuclease G